MWSVGCARRTRAAPSKPLAPFTWLTFARLVAYATTRAPIVAGHTDLGGEALLREAKQMASKHKQMDSYPVRHLSKAATESTLESW